MNSLILWIAQGFGVGRLPVAPGTFGSALGLLWFAALLGGGFRLFLLGTLGGLAVSIWLCGEAERLLHAKDPGCIVLDEIVAIPVCFAGWVMWHVLATGRMPSPSGLVAGRTWIFALGVFLAFRLFDVLKPWPVRQSQALPGGVGVTVDDLLAAVYVNGVFFLTLAVMESWWPQHLEGWLRSR